MIVMLIGEIAPAPMPCTARKMINVSMLHANPHSTDPTRNAAIPANITGRRPTTSDSLPYSGVVTAVVSRYTENSHGKCENPPRSRTTDGTAVAMIVLSSATSPVASITDASTGPRSDRSPTPRRSVKVASAMTTPYDRGRPRTADDPGLT